MWGDFPALYTLPQVYGQVTLSPQPYDSTGHFWFIADHPIQAVETVLHEGKAYGNWRLVKATDPTGHAVALLETGDSLKPGSLVVSVRGKLDPKSGELINRAEEIVFDLLARVSGYPLARSDLDALRPYSVRLSGVVRENTRTAQAQLDEILQSAGLAWSSTLPGWAIPWPPENPDQTEDFPELNPLNTDNFSAQCALVGGYGVYSSTQLSGRLSSLLCHYGYNYASGQPMGMLLLNIPGAEGDRQGDLTLSWIQEAWQAEQIAQRWLAWRAKQIWTIQTGTTKTSLRAGNWVKVTHPYSPVDRALVTISARSGASVNLTALAASGDDPTIRLVSSGTTTGLSVSQANASISVANGRVVISVTDSSGNPLSGAKVTLDGSAVQFTDSKGQAVFTASKGQHIALIQVSGMIDQRITVEAT